MTKKAKAFGALLGLVIVIGVILMTPKTNNASPYPPSAETGAFALSEYEEYIELNPSKRWVEPIQNAEDAKGKGELLLCEEYNKKAIWPYDRIENMALATYYDNASACWLIKGIIPDTATGINPCIIIREDGKVIAIFYE